MNVPHRLLTRRMRPVDAFLLDVFVGMVAAVLLCGYAALESPMDGGVREPLWVSCLTGVLIGLPVAVRRRWPAGVAVVVTGVSAVALATGVIPDYAAAAPAFTVSLVSYTVGLLVPQRRSIVTAIGCLAAMSAALIIAADQLWSGIGAVVFSAAMITPGWLIGWIVRERRAYAAWHSDQLVRQAATEERVRVARELHDVVGHTLSLIAVKASVAVHVAEQRPQETLDALRVIDRTSREALGEIRHLLGMLRDDTPYAPPPGLDDLPALTAAASAGGVEVHLDVRADGPSAAAVPEAMGLSVYRIVQEALTNVVKHAAPATCRATVAVGAGTVHVEVTDDGRRPVRTGGAGHGLIGMRERVGLHGGTFAAGPRPGGGFVVTALLPLPPAPHSGGDTVAAPGGPHGAGQAAA
ncbi:sensor histidine kinase [Dactylosporangium sp. NPDC051484]|uniref:sensor histidine kinase n=1 Tax=Dactylosporangium sp. NPDC051484 TaxID=3154942 RepID=UPI00344D4DA1